MIPIAKNISVIDEQGNHYEATYPKRAKGLVKKGRARFIDEKTICLACPPDEYLEETIMEENREAAIPETGAAAKILTPEEIIKKIDELKDSIESLSVWLEQIQQIDEPLDLPCAVNIELVTKAQAMRDIVVARETTMQKLLEFYSKVYDDIKPDRGDSDKQFIINLIKSMPVVPGMNTPDYAELIRAAHDIRFRHD